MFCNKCGNELGDADVFCKKCGQKVEEISLDIYESKVDLSEENESDREIKANKNEQLRSEYKEDNAIITFLKRHPIGILLVLIVIVLFFAVVKSYTPTINLDEYLILEAVGYDGYGTPKAYIDWQSLNDKYGNKLKFTDANSFNNYILQGVYQNPVDVLAEFTDVSFDRSAGLSNGDNVSYTWNVPSDYRDYIKCNLNCSDGSFEVKGLKEVGTIDVFKGISLKFDGIAPNGKATLSYSGEFLDGNDFACDKMSNLSNGDIINVTLKNTDYEWFVNNTGCIPVEVSRQYTVRGLTEYVKSFDELSDEFVSKIKSDTMDIIYAHDAKRSDSDRTLKDLEYAGYILNIPKKETGKTGNCLYIIYSGIISSTKNKFLTTRVYFPVKYEDIINNGSEYTYNASDKIYGSSSLGGIYGTVGYINPLTCYEELVEANRDKYNSECGDGIEEYSSGGVINKISDINEEYMNTIQSMGMEVVRAYLDKKVDNFASTDPSYVGCYFLVNKNQSDDFAKNNKLFMVYCSFISDTRKGKFANVPVYFPVEYDGIVKFSNKDYMITKSKDILGGFTFPHSLLGCHGYMDGEEMYKTIVTKNRSEYTYDISDTLKQFGGE